MNAPINAPAGMPLEDRTLALRLFARVAERAPDQIPTMIATFATEGDFEMLEAILRPGAIALPATDCERQAYWSSTFPVLEASNDAARAVALIKQWAEALRIDTDHVAMSKHLIGVKSEMDARGLLALGADPNYVLETSGRRVTVIGDALDRGYSAVLPIMLDHLLKAGALPIHSFVDEPGSSEIKTATSLFAKVLRGLAGVRVEAEECVVEYLGKHELPGSWKSAIGVAFAACEGKYGVSYFGGGLRPLMDLLLTAKFDDPSQWHAALAGDRYMDAMVSNGGYFYKLSRIVQAAAKDGVDINSWRANWRLEGVDYPVPLLAFATKYGQTLTVQRFLELGAETEFRMPGDNDAPGGPYMGPTLIEYAQQNSVKAETQQVLSAWRAQQAVQRVTGIKATSNGSAP